MNGGLQIGYITYVDMGNLNASFSGTNVVVIKKIKTPMGDEYPYVSGQMLRHIYREKLRETGWELSPIQPTGESEGNPKDYIDDDIFGFMATERRERGKKGKVVTRTSPVKVSAMLGMYPLLGNKDLLVRCTKERIEEQAYVEQEFTGMNYFKGVILIDLDSIGKGEGLKKEIIKKGEKKETIFEASEFNLEDDERKKRVQAFLDAFRLKFGGAKQARMLCDITPKFVVGVKQKFKVPMLLDALKVDEEGNIVINPIMTVLEQYKDIIEDKNLKIGMGSKGFDAKKVVIGVRTGIFKNEEDIKKKFEDLSIEVLDSNEAIIRMKDWI